MLAALGVEVILMDRRTGVVRMLDEEIGQLFAQHLKDVGVDVRLGQKIQELRHSPRGQAEVLLGDGETVEAPVLFYSMGRVANVGGLNLASVGVGLDEVGNISVNSLFQTACPAYLRCG